MPDEVKQGFVRSFVSFLKREVDSQTLDPDQQESIEVAMQCLQAAFSVSDNTAQESGAVASKEEIDIFDLYQNVFIDRNPDNLTLADNIKNEGNRLMKDGKFNEALLQYNRAILYDSKNPIYYCNRAAAHIRLAQHEQAVADCKTALLYKPDYGKAYGRLGIAYSNLQKYDEAIAAYMKAIELEPDNQDFRNNLEVARNALRQPTNTATNIIPQLQEGLTAMLSNPVLRNVFQNAELDLDQLQQMSQNPQIMNAIGQLFGGAPGGMGNNMGLPQMSNELLQLFQSFAQQLSSGQQQQSGGNGPGNNEQSGDGKPSRE